MRIDQARAELEVLEIERTNLSEEQMVGFRDGYDLAGSGDVTLAQGAIDLIAVMLEREAETDLLLGALVGFLTYHQELLRLMSAPANNELLLLDTPREVH